MRFNRIPDDGAAGHMDTEQETEIQEQSTRNISISIRTRRSSLLSKEVDVRDAYCCFSLVWCVSVCVCVFSFYSRVLMY